MATKSETLFFRASPELAAALQAQAEAAGTTVSAYLRDLAMKSEAIDERDAELADRLAANEDEALAELLGLNVCSLVHRFSLGCDYAGGLVLRLAARGSSEKQVELIAALVGAVDLMRSPAADFDDLVTMSGLWGRQIARFGAQAS